jgi:hypothetical protein
VSSRNIVEIERPAGTGRVTKNDQTVASVQYALKVCREDLQVVKTGEQVKGLKNVTGVITSVGGELLDLGDYTLHLADGRQVNIIVHQDDLSGHYEIRGNGDFY